MALRKGLGGCWAEGDSLSGMAVHYTMVTRSGLGSRGPLLLTSGHWWLVAGWCSGGGALVRESRVSTWLLGAHCGYLFCCRCHPRTLSMSPHSAVTRLAHCSLHCLHHLCTSVLAVTVSVSCCSAVSGCCPARGVSLTTALCLNPTFHCAGPPAPAQPGPLTARSRPGARRRGPPPATRAGRGGAGVRPTTQLATAAQLSPTWSQPPPGSPGRYPAMIIQNARTKS